MNDNTGALLPSRFGNCVRAIVTKEIMCPHRRIPVVTFREPGVSIRCCSCHFRYSQESNSAVFSDLIGDFFR